MSQTLNKTKPEKAVLLDRVLSFIWPKMTGSTVAISAFFVAYFWVLNHPFGEVTVMPLLALDRWMPLLPWSAWIYFSLWVYICLPSSLMARLDELGHYLMGSVLLSGLGLSIFFFLPTVVPSWGIDWSQYPTLFFLKESDASGNACPSLHVGFAVYSAAWFARMLKLIGAGQCWRLTSWLWCLLIVLSTMTTKQHVFVDVFCGAVLGALVFWFNNRVTKKPADESFNPKLG